MASPRVFELDFLRGIAVLLVLATHSPSTPGASGWLRPLDLFFHQFGWSGVDLFFVLSGYLIGGLLFSEIKRHGSLDVRRFLLRRMLRIWPAYYILLAYIFATKALVSSGGATDAWGQIWPSLVHIQNFMGGGPRDQLWSLAVEEHFYLALPICLWLALKVPAQRQRLSIVPWTCLAFGLIGLVLRISSFLEDPNRLRYPTQLSLDALWFGVCLAHLKAYRPGVLERVAEYRWLFLVALGLMLPAALFRGVVRETIGFTGLYLGYGLLLILLVHRRSGDSTLDRVLSGPGARWIATVGTASYSIYLWHREIWTWHAYELGLWMGRTFGLPAELTWALHTTLYIAAGVAVGMIFERLIERPISALRNRLFPPRSTPQLESLELSVQRAPLERV